MVALRYPSGRPPPFLTFAFPMMALFDTTSRAVGGRLGPRGRASRESHPSEDLSELPPLLVAVAGQEYHYWIAGEGRAGLPRSPAAMRNSPPQATLWTDGHRSAPSLAVFDAGSQPAQVVLAHPPASLQPPSRRASRQRTYPAAGYSIYKDQDGNR